MNSSQKNKEKRYVYAFTMLCPVGAKTLIVRPSLKTNDEKDEVELTNKAIDQISKSEGTTPTTVFLTVADLEKVTLVDYKMQLNQFGIAYGKVEIKK